MLRVPCALKPTPENLRGTFRHKVNLYHNFHCTAVAKFSEEVFYKVDFLQCWLCYVANASRLICINDFFQESCCPTFSYLLLFDVHKTITVPTGRKIVHRMTESMHKHVEK